MASRTPPRADQFFPLDEYPGMLDETKQHLNRLRGDVTDSVGPLDLADLRVNRAFPQTETHEKQIRHGLRSDLSYFSIA